VILYLIPRFGWHSTLTFDLWPWEFSWDTVYFLTVINTLVVAVWTVKILLIPRSQFWWILFCCCLFLSQEYEHKSIATHVGLCWSMRLIVMGPCIRCRMGSLSYWYGVHNLMGLIFELGKEKWAQVHLCFSICNCSSRWHLYMT